MCVLTEVAVCERELYEESKVLLGRFMLSEFYKVGLSYIIHTHFSHVYLLSIYTISTHTLPPITAHSSPFHFQAAFRCRK